MLCCCRFHALAVSTCNFRNKLDFDNCLDVPWHRLSGGPPAVRGRQELLLQRVCSGRGYIWPCPVGAGLLPAEQDRPGVNFWTESVPACALPSETWGRLQQSRTLPQCHPCRRCSAGALVNGMQASRSEGVDDNANERWKFKCQWSAMWMGRCCVYGPWVPTNASYLSAACSLFSVGHCPVTLAIMVAMIHILWYECLVFVVHQKSIACHGCQAGRSCGVLTQTQGLHGRQGLALGRLSALPHDQGHSY